MRLTASDFASYHRPTRCNLRVFLRHRREEEAAPGPYDEVLRRLDSREVTAEPREGVFAHYLNDKIAVVECFDTTPADAREEIALEVDFRSAPRD